MALRLTSALERDLWAGLVLARESRVPLLSIWAGAFQRVEVSVSCLSV